jgi:hypothetical protein
MFEMNRVMTSKMASRRRQPLRRSGLSGTMTEMRTWFGYCNAAFQART